MALSTNYSVRAIHCHHRASDDEIYHHLCRIAEPLKRSIDKIRKARKIVIKTNMMRAPIERFAGRRRELVDDSVMRAVLIFLKEHSNAQIVATDTHFKGGLETINYIPLLQEFGVEYIDSTMPPFKTYEVPGGGLMFSRYKLHACFDDADAVVSVSKMKNHAFMGITLCLKNLFGVLPLPPHNRPRIYFHHLIRLPYFLVDLGMIMQPCLNVVDALVGQSQREWDGEGRICNALIAGDHPISTDACGTWLMGHDPVSDWPTPPFKRDRNALAIAAESGFGTVNLDEMDFQTDLEPPLAEFDSCEFDSAQEIAAWRKTTCEQALFYRAHQDEIMNEYAGQYVLLQDGEVTWHGVDTQTLGSWRELHRDKPNQAPWLKHVGPADEEGEHFRVYEEILAKLS